MSIPLPQHPRPDFERKEWLNLNGTWKFKFDKENVGKKEAWFNSDDFPLDILVPFGWGSPLSGVKDEAIFAAMGFCGVALYQFLENSAIYYTNASNVAMLTSFGPVATALMARCTGRRSECAVGLWIGSALAIAGVALISFNNAVVFELRPLGDLMVFGAILAWSVYSMLVEKTKEFPPVLVIRKTFGWALAMMVPLAAWGTTEAGYSALDGAFSVTLDSRRTACASPSR